MGTDKTLTVTVKVQGPKSTDTSQTDVTVQVTDVNDNAPVVCIKSTTPCPNKPSPECPESNEVEVQEGKEEGTFVAEFQACDADTGKNAEFR